MNEFKISALRQFGSENISFTATVHSDAMTLTDEEIDGQITQINKAISKAFLAVCDRELSEKTILLAQSEKRQKANEELNARLDAEVKSADKMRTNGSKVEKMIGEGMSKPDNAHRKQ